MGGGEYGLEEWLGVFLPYNLDDRYRHPSSELFTISHLPWGATVEKD
jgi:hypothetical protein